MTKIDDYLKDVTPSQRASLLRIRDLVKEIEPGAEETISYGMPTLKYKGKPIIHFAAFKNHMSIFPTGDPMQELKQETDKFRTSKGTLQFTEDNHMPESVIRDIINYRLSKIPKD